MKLELVTGAFDEETLPFVREKVVQSLKELDYEGDFDIVEGSCVNVFHLCLSDNCLIREFKAILNSLGLCIDWINDKETGESF